MGTVPLLLAYSSRCLVMCVMFCVAMATVSVPVLYEGPAGYGCHHHRLGRTGMTGHTGLADC